MDSDGEEGGLAGKVEGEERWRRTKNLVVFPLMSSIPSAKTGTLLRVAAMLLEIDADFPVGSEAAISAARLVDETSCLSTPLKCVARKELHCVQA